MQEEQEHKPEPRVVIVDQIGDQPTHTITGRIVESRESVINRALIDLAMAPRRPIQTPPPPPELVGMGRMTAYGSEAYKFEREREARDARTKAYIDELVASGEQTPEEGRRQASKAEAKRRRKQERNLRLASNGGFRASGDSR